MAIHVVLYQPEIPQNTGQHHAHLRRRPIATLHLIEPLGFKLDPKSIKRSAVDYLALTFDYEIHPDWNAFYTGRNGRFVFITRYGVDFAGQNRFKRDRGGFVFGVRTRVDGHPQRRFCANHLETCVRLPMTDRSPKFEFGQHRLPSSFTKRFVNKAIQSL
ncbi:MAG: tRNA (uridine(34)/cytosine(34)/5-carboxymethylaminomethyluridine(34)-2'-O)-methyltransferase TrmL [Bacillus subtilis]|nr:tRNA (uridine(34)/cytosine(34)/5-carboxymethylaminomethyluridine(34)-2'-O)-methyltransferase TrmL [Bacillus subtilis]